jgi:hypothetical protein
MPGIRQPLNIFFYSLALLYLFVEWFFTWGKNERWFLWTALLTLVMTNIASYRTATTNYIMMLPVLFMIFAVWDRRWQRAGRWSILLIMAVLGIGLWALFLGNLQGNQEPTIMYLPLPFFCLFGLWWVRWWAIRPPRVLLEDLVEKVH